MNIFLITMYIVTMLSCLVVFLLDIYLSKKILSREGEFNSKVNYLNSSVQNCRKSLEDVEIKIKDLESRLSSFDNRLKELEEKNNKNSVVKKPLQKKTVQKKVYKNNNNKTDEVLQSKHKVENESSDTVKK